MVIFDFLQLFTRFVISFFQTEFFFVFVALLFSLSILVFAVRSLRGR